MKFEIDFNSKGEPFFHFKADNGKIIVHSQGYDDIRDCNHAIELIKKFAATARVEDIRYDLY